MGKIINVQNAHFSKCTKKEGVDGIVTYTYDVPVKVKGLEKISIVPTKASGEQYGDGVLVEKISRRTGYTLGVDLNNIPNELKRYLMGLTYTNGVETDDGNCTSGGFAFGCEHVKADDTVEMIWFIYCEAEPIEEENSQSTKDINISNETLNITAFKVDEYNKRAYIKISTADENVTEDMIANFFKKVQTGTTIEGIS